MASERVVQRNYIFYCCESLHAFSHSNNSHICLLHIDMDKGMQSFNEVTYVTCILCFSQIYEGLIS